MDNFAQEARATLSRMHLREQAIEPHYQGFMADLQMLAKSSPDAYEEMLTKRQVDLCEAYGFGRQAQSKSFAFADGVALIPISGTLINRFGQGYSFLTGYNFIRAQHNAAMLDPDVKVIVHDHNSYGGEAAGCFELADDIAASRGTKPILAVVDSNCYSASYALASAADKIIVTPSGGVGSVGVVAMHVDMSKMLEDFGVKITFIHSGDHKVDGNPYEGLSKEVKADIQAGVDKSRAKFVALVARNRGMEDKAIHDTQARTYRADDALALGLIDAIAVPRAALQAYMEGKDVDTGTESASNPETPESTMSTNEASSSAAPAAKSTEQAVAEALAADRARASAITSCEEAKGREALAAHFAANGTSLADAKAALILVPVAAAAPAQAEPAAGAPNAFKDHMDNATHPNVGGDNAANSGTDEDMSEAQKILRSYSSATGWKPAKA